MKRTILLVSPPFYSHVQPMIALARAFQEAGHPATVACSQPFEKTIVESGVGYYPMNINRNANTGVARTTNQPEEEKERLEAFLEATRAGAVETLLLQAEHRELDMLTDPDLILGDIGVAAKKIDPLLWIVNQLSYSVTLALTCMGERFVSFCPGHPSTIPGGSGVFGVPSQWPEAVAPSEDLVLLLREKALRVERQFTDAFNDFIHRKAPHNPSVPNAFRFTSNEAVLYNYPPFPAYIERPDPPMAVFMGRCFQPQSLVTKWKKLFEDTERKPRILITLGTFLSAREDVLRRCIQGARRAFPDGLIIVAAGTTREALLDLEQEGVVIEEFLPQRALLPYMDVLIHHGGNNSFTESLAAGCRMVIIPFSSDQFEIAADAERERIAVILDPNRFTEDDLGANLATILENGRGESIERWRQIVSALGPEYAVDKLDLV